MKSQKQLTTVKQINDKLIELHNLLLKISLFKSQVSDINVHLALFFSEDCAECGKYKDDVLQSRNEFKLSEAGISELESAIDFMAKRIDPKNSDLNKDYY